MVANLPSALVAFFLEVVLMGIGTVLGVVRSARRSMVESHRTISEEGDAEEGGGVD